MHPINSDNGVNEMKSVWIIKGLNDGGWDCIFTSRQKALDYAIEAAGPVYLTVQPHPWLPEGHEVSSEGAYLTIERVDLNPKW